MLKLISAFLLITCATPVLSEDYPSDEEAQRIAELVPSVLSGNLRRQNGHVVSEIEVFGVHFTSPTTLQVYTTLDFAPGEHRQFLANAVRMANVDTWVIVEVRERDIRGLSWRNLYHPVVD